MPADIERSFLELGGRFVTPAVRVAAKLEAIRALVFDWDGVFNSGAKGMGGSGFTEPDSMGTNMLRFALWRRRGMQPICAILSGADNPTAREFAEREHFHDVYSGMRDKSAAFAALMARHNLAPTEIAFVFDDINDLAVARASGLRILVRRDASPLLLDHVAENGLCDYVTGHEGGRYPVREACELLIGLLGQFEAVVTARSSVDAQYQSYFSQRQQISTESHNG
jgi:3-deoxy-D-manno-octulosonate 8-phosphate phosphatase (KDO 8-P phosphatase)